MRDDPLISVILPTYNRANLLPRALKSVLKQSYQNLELIVIDDGSNDDTESIVKNFNDARIVYTKHKKNKGGSAARNTGIKMARGEYIAFQDSDDEWTKDKLQKQVELIKRSRWKVKFVYTACWKDRSGKREKNPLHMPSTRKDEVHRNLLKGNFISTPTVVMHKGCFKRAGFFDERFPQMQDWELWIRVSRYYDLEFINEGLVVNYATPNSVLCNMNNHIVAYKLFLDKYYDDFIKNDKKSLAELYYRLGKMVFSYQGDYLEGVKYFYKAARTYFLNIKYLITFIIAFLGPTFYRFYRKKYSSLLEYKKVELFTRRIFHVH